MALSITTQATPRSPAYSAKDSDISPKDRTFDRQLRQAYQGLEGDITDVFYAGEILHHLMTGLLGAAGPVTLSNSEGSMLLHAMHLMTNRAGELKDKFYAGFEAVPTEGTA